MLSELVSLRARLVEVGLWPESDTVLYTPTGTFQQSNYVLLFPGLPRFESERYTGVARADGRRDFDVPFKAVGVQAGMVLNWLERVSGLEGERLTVDGRSCTPLEIGTERGVLHDSSVKPGLFFIDGWVRFTSRPG